MADIVATLSQLARQSPHISQRSGVSVRLSVSNYEIMVANAARRTLLAGEDEVVPRVCDLEALPASTAGKIEIETLEEGREGQILDHLVRSADPDGVPRAGQPREPGRRSWRRSRSGARSRPARTSRPRTTWRSSTSCPVAAGPGRPSWSASRPTPAAVASAVELVLEGLHLSKRLNKDAVGGRAQYRARG